MNSPSYSDYCLYCVRFYSLWLQGVMVFPLLALSSFGVKIYISPSKALVQEKLRSWNQKLGSWGINCLELTGDNESYNIRNIQEADIVLTTPEVIYIT